MTTRDISDVPSESSDSLRSALLNLCDAMRDVRALLARAHLETAAMTGRSAADGADVAEKLRRIDGRIRTAEQQMGGLVNGVPPPG